MRRHPLRALGTAGESQYLSLPDVPEGVGLAIRLLCRDRKRHLRPDRLVPTRQYGTESRLGWVVAISNLPSQTTMQNYGPEKVNSIVSQQHPDHD